MISEKGLDVKKKPNISKNARLRESFPSPRSERRDLCSPNNPYFANMAPKFRLRFPRSMI
jgi:hypothetical protein